MPSKLATVAAVAMALYCPASAETRISMLSSSQVPVPALEVSPPPARTTPQRSVAVARLGAVRGRGRVSAVSSHTEGTRTTFAFDLVTSSKTPVEVSVSLYVVENARLGGLVARIGSRELVTEVMHADRARLEFVAIKERRVDPVLVERVASVRDGDELRVRAWPLTRDAPAHVELVIDTPPEGGWTIDESPAGFVSDTTSLIAIEQRVAVPTVVIGCSFGHASSRGDLDKATIRRYMKRQLPRVKGCYDTALLRDARLAGKVELHFAIGNDGRTRDASVDGDLAEADDRLRACITEELARFEFPAVPAMAGTVQVNYPLELRTY